MALGLAAVSGVGVHWLDPQQGVVRQRLQGGGGGWGEGGMVGGEYGVVVFLIIHAGFWEMTQKQNNVNPTSSTRSLFQ